MRRSKHIFFLMNHVFIGFFLSLFFGVAGFIATLLASNAGDHKLFAILYFEKYNFLLSGGLIFSVFLLMYKTQRWIPVLIELVFSKESLLKSEYNEQKSKFFGVERSIIFSAVFVVIGYTIIENAGVPINGVGRHFLILMFCTQYGMGVYVGRKLFYIAQMIQSIERLPVTEEVFESDRLGMIPIYVNSLTTLTAIFIYSHVYFVYNGPFSYESIAGESMRVFFLLPVIIASPVIAIFNFYPRAVLHSIYKRSISKKLELLRNTLDREHLTYFEKLIYLIEYDKISQEELKHRIRVSLSDLPIAIVSIAAIISLVFR